MNEKAGINQNSLLPYSGIDERTTAQIVNGVVDASAVDYTAPNKTVAVLVVGTGDVEFQLSDATDGKTLKMASVPAYTFFPRLSIKKILNAGTTSTAIVPLF